MISSDIAVLIQGIRRRGLESRSVEVKSAHGGTPASAIRETLSAFANTSGGGVIVLGLAEDASFQTVGVHDVQRLQSDIACIASDELSTPLRVLITPTHFEDHDIVTVEVPEIDLFSKPCYIVARGIQNGSYIRVGPSNRRMTPAEIFDYQVFQHQRTFDDRPVPSASLAALSQRDVNAYVSLLQEQTGRDYGRLSLDETALRFRLAIESEGTQHPTLAGLICFGEYPQQALPQLRIVFTHYFGTSPTERGPDGARYLDNRQFEGSAPAMLRAAQVAIRNVLPIATTVDGLEHRDVPTFPPEVIRELLANAVAHRDYGPFSIGSNIQVRLFRDRLEIRSPGGLFGGVSLYSLETAQSTRNPLLMRFLEDLGLVEQRGGGIDEVLDRLRRSGLPEPSFSQADGWFQVTLPRPFETAAAKPNVPVARAERQDEIILDFLRREGVVRNRDVRAMLGVADARAVQILHSLVESQVIELRGRGRGAHYVLATPDPEDQTD